MKHTRQRTLPFPLLSPLGNDVEPNRFELKLGPSPVTADEGGWMVAGTIEYNCPSIRSYVDRKLAGFGVHVECPRTFYRDWRPQVSPDVSFYLPKDLIRGRVEILAMCVALSDIEDYKLEGQHPDYENSSFSVQRGDCLAVARHLELTAFPDLDPIRKISSILDIRKSEQPEGPAEIFLEADRIEVNLSQSDFRSYVELRSDKSIRGLIANGIVFPAILQALNYVRSMSADEREQAKAELRWCRCLLARMEQGGVSFQDSPEEVFLAAQKILREPVKRGLTDLMAQLQ